MNQRFDFVEAKREMKRLHDEHLKETSEGNTPFFLYNDQNKEETNNSKDLNNMIVKSMRKQDGGPILRSHKETCRGIQHLRLHQLNGKQHDDWKSNKNWNSWRSSYMCAWLKFELHTKKKKVIHPCVLIHFAPLSTLNTSTSSLSPTSLVLLSSSSPNPDLLSTYPLIHCEDPRQDGTSMEFHSSTFCCMTS